MFKRDAEIMQYRTDKLSYLLCTFAIIFDMVFFVSIYTNRSVVPDAYIGADVLTNIIFMMIVFLASEKVKVYAKNWNIYAAIAGAVQILRIFWLPMHFKELEMLVGNRFTLAVIWLLVSGILLFLAAINSTINCRILSTLEDRAKLEGN